MWCACVFKHTANKLNFSNSFKMKFAIIVGVIQMVAGVCTKCANCLFFQDWVTLYWVYIPEMVFINSIFGYLCLLILSKWTTNWDATYVLNNNEIVSIPQVYCKYEPKERQITNLPCWTAPFEYSKDAASKLYGGLLDTTEGWCMKGNVATAGCAVYELNGKLIVEQVKLDVYIHHVVEEIRLQIITTAKSRNNIARRSPCEFQIRFHGSPQNLNQVLRE